MFKECKIKGFEGLYKIYPDKVYNVKKNCFVKTFINNGYEYIKLSNYKGTRLSTGLHRIIALHWIGNIPKNKEVNHKDLNKLNNHYSNLEIITHKANIKHARKLKNWHGGRDKGFTISKETKSLMSEKKKQKMVILKEGKEYTFNSITELSSYLGITRIYLYLLRKENKSYKGYMFLT